ncbi:hypothetical protein EJ05DRAFT_477833 [Pseudovirgaria hyperparasitica]|uniref:Uncharacterized protein n=1 Tax=Pseudovirgaria hyperparasitica TaxID=470096 RepID=A0A6A6W3M7_9PEZI|nr:uncharacterized protein EJ05DRAFT_477833 [Pseudovirgaria hyperparasitica]KAF2756749.1 hypothetical protein EJ05DRAFT_477833 [Pseudovirgaria hyperparasitica]
MQLIPPPQPRELLPPLLACLPTAFVSERPPPALLPLLSPILRQRVQFMPSGTHSEGSWLKLLNWDAQRASKLPSIVESMSLEPHPVSGEIELEDVDDVKFRRLDSETLHARLDLSEFRLVPIFLWVTGDEAGGGDGWRLTELRSLEDKEDGSAWFASATEATVNADSSSLYPPPNHHPDTSLQPTSPAPKDEDDEDDYWASYDRTPGRTPAKLSPAPNARGPSNNSTLQSSRTSELEYFARYANEVQPAMDPHDPDEEVPDAPPSTLNHHAPSHSAYHPPQYEPVETSNIGRHGYDSSMPHAYDGLSDEHQIPQEPTPVATPSLSQPRPISRGSSVGSITKLEEQAAKQAQAEVAVKQHIGTDIKSLFRLAKSVGMDRGEFERIVTTELELLGMMEMDE